MRPFPRRGGAPFGCAQGQQVPALQRNHLRHIVDRRPQPTLTELPELRDRVHVFRDRADAGHVLAEMLAAYRGSAAIVMAIPAGGVAVGAALARDLGLPLDVAVVSKATLPWNTEAGYGAVAFDGTVLLNDDLLAQLNLTEAEVQQGIAAARAKVSRRLRRLRGDRPLPSFAGRTVILVDDGIASGFTLRAAIQAVRQAGAEPLVLAVPTAHRQSLQAVIGLVEAVYCPNVRGGWGFAVADAYQRWSDVDEAEVAAILAEFAAASA